MRSLRQPGVGRRGRRDRHPRPRPSRHGALAAKRRAWDAGGAGALRALRGATRASARERRPTAARARSLLRRRRARARGGVARRVRGAARRARAVVDMATATLLGALDERVQRLCRPRAARDIRARAARARARPSSTTKLRPSLLSLSTLPLPCTRAPRPESYADCFGSARRRATASPRALPPVRGGRRRGGRRRGEWGVGEAGGAAPGGGDTLPLHTDRGLLSRMTRRARARAPGPPSARGMNQMTMRRARCRCS